MALEELYTRQILALSKQPHNKGVLATATHHAPAENKSCGDKLVLYLTVEDGMVTEAAFDGHGCAISQAAASLLTDKLKGLPVADAKVLTPGDIYTMLGIPISPSRTKCALLAYSALGVVLKEL